MKLYELKFEIEQLFDEETGEITDPELMQDLCTEFDDRIENIALAIKNYSAEAEALKKEKLVFEKRQKAAENKVNSLKKYLAAVLEGQKFKTDLVSISYRASEKVNVNMDEFKHMDINKLQVYIKHNDPEPDLTTIKEALKSGLEIPGCTLISNNNIQIK